MQRGLADARVDVAAVTRAIVLFSGMGGSIEGAIRADWDVRLAVDGWDKACVAHRRWHPVVPVVQACCEDANRLARGPFDAVWASPSCKPYSVANRTPKRGTAHPEYYPLALLLEQMQAWSARWMIIENVCGLLWSKEGREEMARFAAAASRARLCWYASVVNSNTVGVAQIRRRALIVVGPEHVRIPHGNEWIPPVGCEPGPMACEGSKGSWERDTRWPKAATADAIRAGTQAHRSAAWDRPATAETAVQGSSGDNARARAQRGIVDASLPGRHANRLLAGQGVAVSEHGRARSRMTRERWGQRQAERAVEAGEHPGRLQTRDGVPHANGRTLAECCDLQQVPLAVLDGFTKHVAHALVGNAVPPPLAEYACRVVSAADRA